MDDENRVLMKRALTGRNSRLTHPIAEIGNSNIDFPLQESVGYQIRATHRLLQRYLQMKIEPYNVTLGMWYFLRALWNEDGLTQRELSNRIGTMEPTTLSAIQIMESRGLVTRVRSKTDRRKIHIRLTPKARKLKKDLIPLARQVVQTSVQTLSAAEIQQLLNALGEVQKNLQAAIAPFDQTSPEDAG